MVNYTIDKYKADKSKVYVMGSSSGGMMTNVMAGSYDESTTFAADDHRTYNRAGAAFDVGETFAGVPFEVGVAAAREIAAILPAGASTSTSQLALRWILDQPGVTTVIPGARNAAQAEANATAADLPPLTEEQLARFEEIYDASIRAHVHDRW